MPRIPGELVAKRTSQKKGLRSKEHKFAVYPPPIATNMEVNLRIVTLVNVEEKINKYIYLHYGKRRGSIFLSFYLCIFLPIDRSIDPFSKRWSGFL